MSRFVGKRVIARKNTYIDYSISRARIRFNPADGI